MKGNWLIGAIAAIVGIVCFTLALEGWADLASRLNHSRARRKAHALNDTDTEETTDERR